MRTGAQPQGQSHASAVTPNPSLEQTSIGMTLGPRSAAGLCCASRAERHIGVDPLGSNVGHHTRPLTASRYKRKSTRAPVLPNIDL